MLNKLESNGQKAKGQMEAALSASSEIQDWRVAVFLWGLRFSTCVYFREERARALLRDKFCVNYVHELVSN